MSTNSELGMYRLMSWLSPSFPVGAYSYSHGIEYAFETGDVTDPESLQIWIEGILKFGSGRVDGALFRAAWEGIAQTDNDLLRWAMETAATQRGSKEMALENAAQGTAFIETLRKSWELEGLAAFDELHETLKLCASYPVTVGVASALSKIELEPALSAYLHAVISNLVSAGVRMIPLGQTAGQQIISSLENEVILSAQRICAQEMDDLRTNVGSAAIMVDWTSMKHETQYTRIFRS